MKLHSPDITHKTEADRPSPLHLVISAYPEGDETHLVTQEGARLFIRPVRPEDAPLFQLFFKVLSRWNLLADR